MLKRRLQKARDILKEKQLEALLITDEKNRYYLSGFSGSSGILLITAKEAILITDFRYLEQAAAQSPDFTIVDCAGSIWTKTVSLLAGMKSVGFEAQVLTFLEYRALQEKAQAVTFVPLSGAIEKLRILKDAEEIVLIKKAAEIADQAFLHMLSWITIGMTEQEVALELEYQMKKLGAQKLAFDSIVATGAHASLPHATPSDNKLKAGDFLKMDFGAVYHGYCSDMTRTVVLGEASEKQREIYQTVLTAQLTALALLAPGLQAREIDAAARAVITQKGYGENFGHGLGHSLGLFIHEEPRLSAADETCLQSGMVFTVEPGIYLAGFGGVRIEDLVLITEAGIENFTKSPKELIILS